MSDDYRSTTGDVALYEQWATKIVDQNRTPYSEFAIEYPPVIPAMVMLPEIGRPETSAYHDRFVKFMLLVDVLCFACLLFIARRWGSLLGPTMWIAGSFLLGPIIYVRLDLLAALATLVAVLCISHEWWRGAGAWLALGALTKVYPLFLAPVAFAYCPGPQRRRFVVGGIAAAVLVSLPYIGSLDDMWRNVVTYHAERGLQEESTWASLIFLAGRSGYEYQGVFAFGAGTVEASVSGSLKTISLLLSVVVLVGGSVLAFYEAKRDSGRERVPVSMLAMLSLLLFTGTVLSPQFVIWPIALAAAALCRPQGRHITWTILLLLPVALMTVAIFRYWELEVPPGLIALVLRNLLFLFVGIELLLALRRTDRADPVPAIARGRSTDDG
ncbi:MAG: glycosyltransferase 87 family protein [Actinomycetota bacterium]